MGLGAMFFKSIKKTLINLGELPRKTSREMRNLKKIFSKMIPAVFRGRALPHSNANKVKPLGKSTTRTGIFHQIRSSELAQSTTEYILILAVVIMVALKFRKTFEGKLGVMIDKLGNNLESAVDEASSE